MAEAPPVRHAGFLTAGDLAEMLGLTVRGARLVLERGELPGFQVGRRWFLRREDLDAAIAEKVAEHRRDPDAAVRILRGLPGSRKARRKP
jgi:excisionase family DNA binding protein